MKKIITLILVAAICACMALTACEPAKNYVYKKVADVEADEFGIAMKLGDTTMETAVNAVITEWKENGKMAEYFNYYSELAGDENATAPEGLQTTWEFAESGETLKMYTESGFAPYEFMLGTSVVGLDVAIMSQVAYNLGYKLQVVDVMFDVVIASMNNDTGYAVAAAGISINEERQKNALFSTPYAVSNLAIVSAEDKAYETLASLDGLKIGVQEGTSGDFTVSDAIDEGEITGTVVQYKTYAAALAALKTGKIDAIFMDEVPAQLLVKNA